MVRSYRCQTVAAMLTPMLGKIGPYEILGELAQGGMGTVYRARDPQLGREVALKLLRADKPMDARGLERFRREVLTLAQFQHPNVVRAHTAGAHRGLPFFVQDLVEGEPLDRRLASKGPLAPCEAADATRKLAAALHAVHVAGILHRDVKPANVIMTPRGEPILIDFGVAKNAALALSQSHLTKTGQGVGSPGYWSPEQACGELDQIGPASDVYSLGATLYALLVGRAPFEGQGIAGNLMLTINEPPQPPRELRAEIPADLEAICLKCLEKEPAHRYASARNLETDLQLFLAGEQPLARGGPTPQSRARAHKLRFVAAALAAPTLLAAIVLGLPPSLDVRSPLPGTILPGDRPLTVEILAGGLLPVRAVEVEGTSAVHGDDALFSTSLDVPPEGEHSLRITARSLLRTTETTLTIRVDSTAPILSLTSPLDYSVHNSSQVSLHGTVRDASTTEVFVPKGASTKTAPGKPFSLAIDLVPGLNEVEVHTKDAAGNLGRPLVLHLARPPPDHDTERLLRPFKVQGELNTYLVTRNLEVSKRERLVLPAGTTLRFEPTAGLVCRGELWASGTRDARVRFIPSQDRWEGIQVLGPQAWAVVAWGEIEAAAPGVVGQALGELSPSQSLGGLSVVAGANLILADSLLRGASSTQSRGGGLRLEGEATRVTSAVVMRSRFEACRAKRGGGAYCGPNTSATFVGCRFQANHASHRGGGLAVIGRIGSVRLINCSFSENTAHWGGGVALDRPATIRWGVFARNLARADGGGLFARVPINMPLELTGLEFIGNVATESGGGAHVEAEATWHACTFTGNRAAQGGGLSVHRSQGGPHQRLLFDCKFVDNEADRGPDIFLAADTDLSTEALRSLAPARIQIAKQSGASDE